MVTVLHEIVDWSNCMTQNRMPPETLARFGRDCFRDVKPAMLGTNWDAMT